MIWIRFRITTLEDLHVGEGINKAGLYDDGAIKDAKGNPAISSETFKGLLRQSLLELCGQEGESQKEEWKGYYRMLFTFSGQNSPDITVDVDTNTLGEENYIIHTFTAIDDKSRTAAKGSLRSIECVKKGVCFDGCLSYNPRYKNSKSLRSFLEEGLRNITWLGSYRRRGLGSVKIDILTEAEPPVTEFVSGSDKPTGKVALLLRLKDDTTIAGAGEQGNHFLTLDHIPGTSVLGMLRVAVGAACPENLDLLGGGCRVENLYPVPEAVDVLERSREEWVVPYVCPVPMSARSRKVSDMYKNVPKDRPHWCFKPEGLDRLETLLSCDKSSDDKTDDSASKSFAGGYIVYCGENNWRFHKPSQNLKLRNAIDSRTQKTEKNSLLTQDSLEKGNRFLGVISFDDPENAVRFIKALESVANRIRYLHVGRGGKPVEIARCCHISAKIDPPRQSHKGGFILTCVSDVIIRDAKLGFSRSLDPRLLDEILGLPAGTLVLKKEFSSTRIIHAYHGLAGVRRFPAQAISKGSVFVFGCENPEDLPEKLAKLEEHGLGERSNEGYGRVVVNLDLLQNNAEKTKVVTYNPEPSPLAQQYEELHKKKDEIIRELEAIKTDEAKGVKTVCLRLFQMMQRGIDPQLMRSWLIKGTSKDTTKKYFEGIVPVFDKYLGEDRKYKEAFSLALKEYGNKKEKR